MSPSSFRSRCGLLVGFLVAGLVSVLISAASSWAQNPGLDRHQLLRFDRTAFRARPFAMMPLGDGPGITICYGDRYSIVRVVRLNGRNQQEIWRSRALEGGPVVEILIEDLDDSGGPEIIARTQQGRIYVWDEAFNSRWESVNENFRNVTAMAIANVDADVAYELVLLADRQINYIDGARFNRETQFSQFYNAQEMLVGQVDTDLEYEIVLNNGTVIDAATGEPDWETEPFGQFIELIDIDGDGLDEVVGYNYNQFLRIYDVDEQQEKPLQ